jgi:hypothetical protein
MSVLRMISHFFAISKMIKYFPIALFTLLLFLKSENVVDGAILIANVSLVVAYTAYKTIKSSNRNGSLIFLSVLATLVFFSFIFQISNTSRWTLVAGLSLLPMFIGNTSINKIKKFSIQSTTLILSAHTFFLIAHYFEDRFLQFSLLGYDNAFHFSLFRFYRDQSVFPFGFVDSWPTDFEQFLNYPAGQAAFWSLLSDLLIGKSDDSSLEFLAFNVLNVFTFFILITTTFRIVRDREKSFFPTGVISLLISVILNVCLFGVMASNGFPPYLFGALILNCFILGFNGSENLQQKIFVTCSCIFILVLVAPTLIAFLLLVVIILGVEILKTLRSPHNRKLLYVNVLVPIGFIILVLWFSSRTSSKFGWRQILADGGVHPPNLFVSILISFTSIVFLLKHRKKLSMNSLTLVYLSGGVSVAFITTLTLSYTGEVQYYAIKQSYVFLQIAAMVLLLGCSHLEKASKYLKNSLQLIVCIVFVVPVLKPSVYTGGFMGTLPKAVNVAWDRAQWPSQIMNPQIFENLKSFNPSVNKACIIYKLRDYPGDLSSRWANSLSRGNNISNGCFAGFWNIDSLGPSELISRLEDLPGNFVLFTDEPSLYKSSKSSIKLISVL